MSRVGNTPPDRKSQQKPKVWNSPPGINPSRQSRVGRGSSTPSDKTSSQRVNVGNITPDTTSSQNSR
eukprot:456326-Ditylum_brightwellii.AAC.1